MSAKALIAPPPMPYEQKCKFFSSSIKVYVFETRKARNGRFLDNLKKIKKTENSADPEYFVKITKMNYWGSS